jgi:hypothetical protein
MLLKLWGLFFIFVAIGQLRFEGGTLEQRFHRYINSPSQQQFFARILTPLHATLGWVGFNVDHDMLRHIKSQNLPQQPRSNLFFSEEKMKLLKENMEERRRILKEADEGR